MWKNYPALRKFVKSAEARYRTVAELIEAGAFDAVLDAIGLQGNERKEVLDWAKDKLKKSNRIQWYLKQLKENKGKPLYEDILHSKDLEHFFSMKIPEIEKFEPSKKDYNEVLDALRGMEEKYLDELGDTKKTGLIEWNDLDKSVLDAGDGWHWVLLDRNACSIEGDAMGHCGNVPSREEGQRILSLRRIVEKAGKKFWEPHATFILDADGSVGEMKGKQNKKPEAKYHPMIMKLVNSDWIKKLKGGGYAPEQNFDLGDLSEEELDQFLKQSPEKIDTDRRGVYENRKDQKFLVDYIVKQLGSKNARRGELVASALRFINTDSAKKLLEDPVVQKADDAELYDLLLKQIKDQAFLLHLVDSKSPLSWYAGPALENETDLQHAYDTIAGIKANPGTSWQKDNAMMSILDKIKEPKFFIKRVDSALKLKNDRVVKAFIEKLADPELLQKFLDGKSGSQKSVNEAVYKKLGKLKQMDLLKQMSITKPEALIGLGNDKEYLKNIIESDIPEGTEEDSYKKRVLEAVSAINDPEYLAELADNSIDTPAVSDVDEIREAAYDNENLKINSPRLLNLFHNLIEDPYSDVDFSTMSQGEIEDVVDGDYGLASEAALDHVSDPEFLRNVAENYNDELAQRALFMLPDAEFKDIFPERDWYFNNGSDDWENAYSRMGVDYTLQDLKSDKVGSRRGDESEGAVAYLVKSLPKPQLITLVKEVAESEEYDNKNTLFSQLPPDVVDELWKSSGEVRPYLMKALKFAGVLKHMPEMIQRDDKTELMNALGFLWDATYRSSGTDAEKKKVGKILEQLVTHSDPEIRFGVAKVNPTAKAISILKKDKDSSVRESLAEHAKLSEEDLLELAHDKDQKVSYVALSRVANKPPKNLKPYKKLVTKILLSKRDTRRDLAVKLTDDQKLLKKIAQSKESWHVRDAAIEKITDKAFLKKLLKTEKESIIRNTIQEKIESSLYPVLASFRKPEYPLTEKLRDTKYATVYKFKNTN